MDAVHGRAQRKGGFEILALVQQGRKLLAEGFVLIPRAGEGGEFAPVPVDGRVHRLLLGLFPFLEAEAAEKGDAQDGDKTGG